MRGGRCTGLGSGGRRGHGIRSGAGVTRHGHTILHGDGDMAQDGDRVLQDLYMAIIVRSDQGLHGPALPIPDGLITPDLAAITAAADLTGVRAPVRWVVLRLVCQEQLRQEDIPTEGNRLRCRQVCSIWAAQGRTSEQLSGLTVRLLRQPPSTAQW